jgi:hypothetical protein
MIIKTSVFLAASLIAFSSNAIALSQQEAESTCVQYASEDGVEAHELDGFIAQCMQDLASEAAESRE